MTKEEAPPRVVRIGIGLRVGVVRPVVAAPLVEVVLQREHVTEGEEEAQRGGGPKGAVRPEAVGAQLNAQRRRLQEKNGKKKGQKGDLRVEQQPSKGEQVKGGHQEDISPDDFTHCFVLALALISLIKHCVNTVCGCVLLLLLLLFERKHNVA